LQDQWPPSPHINLIHRQKDKIQLNIQRSTWRVHKKQVIMLGRTTRDQKKWESGDSGEEFGIEDGLFWWGGRGIGVWGVIEKS
jgi:hypothetical protein